MSQSEVEQLIADVAHSYGTGVNEWLDFFADPLVFAGPENTITFEHDAARDFFDEMRTQLRGRGLDRTEVHSVNVVMLGDDVAFADGSFVRLRSDGSLLEPFRAGYLCRRRNGRWLVVTRAPHTEVKQRGE